MARTVVTGYSGSSGAAGRSNASQPLPSKDAALFQTLMVELQKLKSFFGLALFCVYANFFVLSFRNITKKKCIIVQ